MLAMAFFADYSGDLAWRYFREAAFTRARVDPPDGKRVARLAALGCDVAVRWPGSLRGELPPEETVRELWDLGIAPSAARRLGGADPAPRDPSRLALRVLSRPLFRGRARGARSLGPRGSGDRAPDGSAQSRLRRLRPSDRAVDRAGLVRPCPSDLGATSHDHPRGDGSPSSWATSTRWVRGPTTRSDATRGRSRSPTRASRRSPGETRASDLHISAWRIAALYRLGRWDEALEGFATIRRMLESREDDPPYFVDACVRGGRSDLSSGGSERVRSDALAAAIVRMVTESSGRLYPSILRFLVVRGDLPRRRGSAARTTGRSTRAMRWKRRRNGSRRRRTGTERPSSSPRCGVHAEAADAPSVASFADRLEGRAALASGDLAGARRGLERSAEGFETIEAPWERALTQLDIARASSSARDDESGVWAARAAATFEHDR